MDFESAVQNDRAVSPVIGVILMVAITVILAAVIGTFVIGLGNQTGGDAPRASFDFDPSAGNTGDLAITHETGDTIDASNVVIKSDQDFSHANGSNGATWETLTGEADISAGSSVTINANDNSWSGDTVRLIYQAPGSDSTTTISKKEIS